jgi:hypothetical protein
MSACRWNRISLPRTGIGKHQAGGRLHLGEEAVDVIPVDPVKPGEIPTRAVGRGRGDEETERGDDPAPIGTIRRRTLSSLASP